MATKIEKKKNDEQINQTNPMGWRDKRDEMRERKGKAKLALCSIKRERDTGHEQGRKRKDKAEQNTKKHPRASETKTQRIT
ncbi:hypothetical protein COLO4_38319 [Corchorus olitorius]|uniref:Uncharacterized protein n=1 Tax=Corchorus olitorius TaxID=93759 RepID=A0A1R3FVL0_9ROSI|nr:hypothetical protein COLO4_38319 [Corchorus olitorius]